MADAGRRLQDKIDAFGMRKEAIKAAYTAARAQASIAEAFAGISSEVTDAGTAARHAENEEADLQAQAAALDDLLTADADGGPGPALSDEQLQAQLDQISMRAEVDEELARLSGSPPAPARGTGPFRIPLTCGWRHGRRHGNSAWPRRREDWRAVSRS